MNITEWRASKGKNQAEAAEFLGVAQPTVSRIERGTLFPSPEIIQQFIVRTAGEITADDLHAAWLAKQPAGASV